MASAVVIALAVVSVLSFYDAMPDPYPANWGSSGEANAFREKSVSNVLATLLIGPVFVFVISGIVAIAVGEAAKWSDREPTRFESATDLERRRRLMSATIRNMGWYQLTVITALTVMVGSSLYPGTSSSMSWLWMGVMLAATVVVVVALARAQKRVDRDVPPTNYDPEKLKAGMIYWDAEDERLFISQSNGMNMIPNLGRPGAWGIMGALLLPAAVVTLIAVLAS